MSIRFNTAQVPPSDRAEAIRDVIWGRVVRVDIQHHPQQERISAVGTISDVGSLNICSVRSNATIIRRTPSLVRDDLEPSLFLGLQVSGSSMVVQGDREAVLRPGDLAVYDTTEPYTLVNESGIHQHFFRVPRRELALPTAALSRVTAVRLGREHPVTDLASTYFARLAGTRPAMSPQQAGAVEQPSIALLRAVLAICLGDSRLAQEPLESTLQCRIMEYIRAHLAEHDLSAARIARAHHISVRYLYKILAGSGITLGDWLRVHRLEECRKELARSRNRSVTIAAIAQRWGFSNASHFSRVFKEQYGVSPREWRQLEERRAGAGLGR
ncbi:helix-turn-helix domain-containing protein [Streptomyces sp. NPDC058620]|uniref:helix-turn-helix domain-containing protein n=1 Tax=Streptomyces sp. NPDC058620 TaxID=3346560 RepID=UPI0036549ECF